MRRNTAKNSGRIVWEETSCGGCDWNSGGDPIILLFFTIQANRAVTCPWYTILCTMVAVIVVFDESIVYDKAFNEDLLVVKYPIINLKNKIWTLY